MLARAAGRGAGESGGQAGDIQGGSARTSKRHTAVLLGMPNKLLNHCVVLNCPGRQQRSQQRLKLRTCWCAPLVIAKSAWVAPQGTRTRLQLCADRDWVGRGSQDVSGCAHEPQSRPPAAHTQACGLPLTRRDARTTPGLGRRPRAHCARVHLPGYSVRCSCWARCLRFRARQIQPTAGL